MSTLLQFGYDDNRGTNGRASACPAIASTLRSCHALPLGYVEPATEDGLAKADPREPQFPAKTDFNHGLRGYSRIKDLKGELEANHRWTQINTDTGPGSNRSKLR
jgi:hypothetical protein